MKEDGGGEWKKRLRVEMMEEAKERSEEEFRKGRRKNCNIVNGGGEGKTEKGL